MMKLALCLAVAISAAGQSPTDPMRVMRLLQRAVLVDLHDDTTQMIVDEAYSLGEKHDYGQVAPPRRRTGHVPGFFFSIGNDPDRSPPTEAPRRPLEQMDGVRREPARHPADLELATTADGILAA